MTSDAAAAKTSDLAAAPSVLPAGVRTRILIYLGVLLMLLGFESPKGCRGNEPIARTTMGRRNRLIEMAHRLPDAHLKKELAERALQLSERAEAITNSWTTLK